MVKFLDVVHESLAPLAVSPEGHRVMNRGWREALGERLGRLTGEVMWRLDFWPSETLLGVLESAGDCWAVRDADGEVLAACGEAKGARVFGADGVVLRYPWHILAVNEAAVGRLAADDIRGVVEAGAIVRGHLHLGTGSTLLPGVFIEGNVVIGEGCRVGPNCYIRGNTVIGDGCRIGQAVEIKNCVIGNGVNAGHLAFLGDSVVGDGVNFGAGTITSNFRHDGGNHRCSAAGVLMDTGRNKFGAIIGEGVHTGIHTSIYPGRTLWPGVSTLPGEVARKDKK